MKVTELRESVQGQLLELIRFIDERTTEVSAFNHSVYNFLTKIYLKGFKKPDSHKCCFRYFISSKEEAAYQEALAALQPEERSQVCTCNALDMIMQTNNLVNDQIRGIVYSLVIRMM
mmetsp:Transcript_18704/g.28660  ORF Transcript_18704/g.28660 Transcript_18704/m.28660 type:complete len:117 (+) Transcript_18704:684-1034(+)